MGTVFLGMPGPWAEDNREASDHYTTKIGGAPDWPSKELDIKPELLKCRLCGGRLCLVAQVYAPLSIKETNIEERNLYVFGCPEGKCADNPLSWRTLRIQKCQNESHSATDHLMLTQLTESKPGKSSEEDMWAIDDEDDSDMDLEELGEALSRAASAASHSKKQNGSVYSKPVHKELKMEKRVADANVPVLPCFYIYSQEEPFSDTISDVCSSYSFLSVKENQCSSAETASDEEKWEGEAYEYDKALKADRTYLKFKKRMDLCPEQCFRYSFGGQPLLAETNAGRPGPCSHCGAERQFEMQLMPSLLYFLQQAADGTSTYSPEEWDWMTLVIYTCSNSCFRQVCKEKSDPYCWTVVEEVIFVQGEALANQ